MRVAKHKSIFIVMSLMVLLGLSQNCEHAESESLNPSSTAVLPSDKSNMILSHHICREVDSDGNSLSISLTYDKTSGMLHNSLLQSTTKSNRFTFESKRTIFDFNETESNASFRLGNIVVEKMIFYPSEQKLRLETRVKDTTKTFDRFLSCPASRVTTGDLYGQSE